MSHRWNWNLWYLELIDCTHLTRWFIPLETLWRNIMDLFLLLITEFALKLLILIESVYLVYFIIVLESIIKRRINFEYFGCCTARQTHHSLILFTRIVLCASLIIWLSIVIFHIATALLYHIRAFVPKVSFYLSDHTEGHST